MEDSHGRMGSSCFTHNGEYFALLSVDGRLRIWNTTSGKIVQEFSPNSTVQSSCTCLCWTRKRFYRDKKKLKRKHKKNEKEKTEECFLFPSLAIGTDKGFLFCYNPTTGEIEKLNKDGHVQKVNSIAYHQKHDIIYTCSDDKYIVEWCAKNQVIKCKWKADNQAVKKLCLAPSETTLLSAGCSIKLWNVETKELLQKFNGHLSPISMLQFSPFRQNGKEGSGDDGYYFVSGSTEDRVINAWQVNSTNHETMAVASFIISDVAIFMDIILDEDDDKPLKLCVGCKDGRIHFFTCTMNGRTSRPIESSKTVDYLMREGTRTAPVPFINARLHKDKEVNLNLVSGQTLKPSFTTLCYADLEVTSKIEKSVSKNLLLSEIKPEKDSSVELANTNCSTKFISDTNVLSLPKAGESVKATPITTFGFNGDLQKTETLEDLSMGERISLTQPDSMDFVVKMKPKKSAPNAGSFAQMLIQALHSNDDKLINEILFNNNFHSKTLMNTVKRIPNTLVESLLRTITDKLLWNPNRSQHLISWLRTIVSVHLTFLLTSEVSREALAGLYRLIKTQEEIHLPLLNLQGKIDMLSSYVCGNNAESGDEEDLANAAVVYDDSSDETDDVDGKVGKTDKDMKEIINSEVSDDEIDHLKMDTDENAETETDVDEAISDQSEVEDEEEV